MGQSGLKYEGGCRRFMHFLGFMMGSVFVDERKKKGLAKECIDIPPPPAASQPDILSEVSFESERIEVLANASEHKRQTVMLQAVRKGEAAEGRTEVAIRTARVLL